MVAFAGILTGCSGSHRSTPVSTATALGPVSQELQRDVAKVWPQAAKLWPDAVFKDGRIIIGDGKTNRMITIDGVTEVSPAKLAEKKIIIPAAGSTFATWDGHPAIVVNAADPMYATTARAAHVAMSTVLFGDATDELFRSGLQDWPDKKKRVPRGTEYPLAVTPRLYRAMIYNDLVEAYRNVSKRKQKLAAAAYWRSMWEKQYPDEARRSAQTDLIEGVVGYFDGVATAVATGGDLDDHDELRAHIPYRPLNGTPDAERLTLDGEGAAIGGVAGLILDETHKGWKNQLMRSGQTPLTIVLNGVTPAAEPADESLRQSITAVLAKQNSELVPRLNPLVSAYNDTDHALLLVPLNTSQGDMDADGYYTSRDVPYSMLARLSGSFKTATGTLRAGQASVLTGTIDGKDYVIVPVDPNAKSSRVSNGRITLKTGTLTGDIGVTARSVGGRQQLVAR